MRKKIFAISTLVLLILTVLSVFIKTSTKRDTDIDFESTAVTGIIDNSTEITYEFVSDKDVNGFKILFGTYGNTLTQGKLTLLVTDADTGQEIGKSTIGAKKIIDNQLSFFDTGLLKIKDKKVKIIIKAKGFVKDKYPTIWIGENSLDEESITTINGEKSNKQMIITTCYISKNSPYTWELILLSTISFLLYICQMEENKGEQEVSVEKNIEDDKSKKKNN